LRTWCDVPVAVLRNDRPQRAETLQRLAAGWQHEDRQLWLVAADMQTILDAVPGAQPRSTRVANNTRFLEQTLLQRPDEYVGQAFSLALAPFPDAG
jgi:hypothetical protein